MTLSCVYVVLFCPSVTPEITDGTKLVSGCYQVTSECISPPSLGHQRHEGGLLQDPHVGVNVARVLAVPGNLEVAPEQGVILERMFVLQSTKGNGGISEPFK